MKLMLSKAGSFVGYFLLIGYLVVMIVAVASIGVPMLGVPVNAWTVSIAVAGGVSLALINIAEPAVARLANIVATAQMLAWGVLIGLFGVTCAWVLAGAVLGPLPWTNSDGLLLMVVGLLFAILWTVHRRR